MKFRKKPVVIEAVQLTWQTWGEVCDFIEGSGGTGTYINAANGDPTENVTESIGLIIPTLEGNMIARQGDWIIRGVKGEFYPCKPDIFEATYEAV